MSREEERLNSILDMLHLAWQHDEIAKAKETDLRMYPQFYSDAEREKAEWLVARHSGRAEFIRRNARVLRGEWFPVSA